jgi:hypothetical protein
MLEVEKSTLDLAGQSRLEQIRASMSGQLPAGPAAPAAPLTTGTQESDAEGTTST